MIKETVTSMTSIGEMFTVEIREKLKFMPPRGPIKVTINTIQPGANLVLDSAKSDRIVKQMCNKSDETQRKRPRLDI